MADTLHTKMKNLMIEKIPNITNFLKDIQLPLSYLGIRYFLSGKQEKMGNKGLEKTLEKMGYELILVPVNKDEDKKTALDLQDKFIDDLNLYLDKYKNDKKMAKKRNLDGENIEIQDILMSYDSSKETKNELGISVEDLF